MKVYTTLSKIPFSTDLPHLQKSNLALKGILTLFKSWYYECLADLCKKISPEKVKRFNDISNRHYGDSITLLFGYAIYPNTLIAPSLNTPREYHEDQETYKRNAYSLFLDNRLNNFHLKDSLCKIGGVLPIFETGFCTGMCMEFISEYFKAINHLPHKKALLQVTEKFSQGASAKAIYSQYLSNITTHPHHQDSFAEERFFLMHCAAASLFDNLDYPQLKTLNNFYSDEDRLFLRTQMKALPQGIYDVNLLGRYMQRNHKPFGHTIVYSNIQDQSFVFCPTIGSFSISQIDPLENFFYLLEVYEKIDKFLSQSHHLMYLYFHPVYEK